MHGRGCMDQVFAVRQVCDKYLANRKVVLWAFMATSCMATLTAAMSVNYCLPGLSCNGIFNGCMNRNIEQPISCANYNLVIFASVKCVLPQLSDH